ncbi:helix-turn-helix domain-containing protein [Streptomyces mirabilis]|uniref:helix-turn-helix domain-containing protein n=1 Tax=Streptomyces mirabilis TaxID=68239 RepID=UPI0036A6D489
MPTRASVAELVATRIQVHRALPPPEQRRELRVSRGLTLDELASALGVSRSCIHAYETGRRTPRGERLTKYVEALRALQEAA